MTIRKGEPWGGSGALLKSSPIVSRDRDLARLIQELRREPRSETDQIEVGLLGGDLHRSLGAPPHSPEDLLSGKGQRLPIDIGIVEFDSKGKTQQWVFVAHLLARVGRLGGIWNGRSAIVMNGSFMGSANLGPRAHPNDGRLDVLDGKLDFSDRRKARQRMLTGTHVPHPSLLELRVKSVVLSDEKPFAVTVDGERVGSARELQITCIPDAATIVV